MQMVRAAMLGLLKERSVQTFHSWQIICLICRSCLGDLGKVNALCDPSYLTSGSGQSSWGTFIKSSCAC